MKNASLIVTILLAVVAQPTVAQDVAATSPGLSLTIQALDAAGNPTGPADTRSVRMIGLHVPSGAPASSFLPPGRFRATWTGNVNLKLRDKYAFVAFGRGTVSVTVDGKDVLKSIGDDLSKTVGEETRLKKGPNAITVVYDSPAAGDSTLRLYWQQKSVRAEPLAPTILTHDPAAQDVHAGDTARAGRTLFANLRCAKCHATPTTPTAMPELAMDGPSFDQIGKRLRKDWLIAWIDDPQSVRPGAHMPRPFKNGADGKPDPRAIDVAAYLMSLDGVDAASEPPPAADDATVQTGGKLYASLFCIACHSQPDAKPDADKGRIPHRNVAAKFTPAGLRAYLSNPEAHYAWNPMPNFHLNEAEANALTAYLLAKSKPTVGSGAATGGDPKAGEALAASSGCFNCHTISGTPAPSTLKAAALPELSADQWTKGCLAETPADENVAPRFALTAQDREALRAFAATDRSSLPRDAADEFSARQWTGMRCASCHTRDGEQAAITTTLNDEADALYKTYFPEAAAPTAGAHVEGEALAPDQRALPLLTWAGEKLRPEWAAPFIHGDISYKPRTYLRARMPSFPARAAGLANGFAAEHGFPLVSGAYPTPDPSQVPVGQRLIAQAGGFSCVQCHSVGPRPPLAPFEAPALNFSHVTERIRKEYYQRWMANPIRVDPSTKMPQFGDADGVTAIRDVFDGDASKQYEAIWNYLLQGNDVKPPQ